MNLQYRDVVLADRPVQYLDLGGGLTDRAGRGSAYTSTGIGGQLAHYPLGRATRFVYGERVVTTGTIPNMADVMTHEIWVRRNTLSGINAIAGRDQGQGWYVRFNGTALEFLKSGVTMMGTATKVVDDLVRFHHIVAAKNGAAVKIYLDGADVTPGSISAATCTNSDAIQLNKDQGEGGIQDLSHYAAYNYMLGRDRVIAHYLAGRGLLPANLAASSLA